MKIFHTSNKEIKSDMLRIIPLLKLIRPDNIDFVPIIGAKCELSDSADKIYFKIKEVFLEDTLNELLTNNYREDIPDLNKSYYICYQTNRALCAIGNDVKDKGGITGFAIEMEGVFYDEIGEFIGSIQFFKDSLLRDEIEEYRETLLEVSDMCYDAIVKAVRDNVNLQKGKFVADNINQNTYMQRRLTDNGEIVDYIMSDYFVKILSESNCIDWVDVSNENTIYSAL